MERKDGDDRHEAHSAATFSRPTIVILLIALASLIGLIAFYASRALQRVLSVADRDREATRHTTEELRHRNNQLNALHNVFSEITETLSLDYVVRATLREAMKLTRADMTVLRLVRGNELAVVGAVTVGGRELTDLPPAPLGEGPNGRVAKTGRSIKFDSDAERMMSTRPLGHAGRSPSAQTGDPQMESGIIVPLIVRMRVIGTLAVYSRAEAAFSAEDQRFLEMMASQVATAVVAADTTDTSERRAHEDVLTGLPNRLQLTKDMDGDLAHLVEQGRPAVVAMADIDHFKRLNDDFGHKVGDVTLQQVAALLRSSVREDDRVYRFGGEEFVLIFLDTAPKEAWALAERIRAAFEAASFSSDDKQPVGAVTISIGLASLPEHGANLNSLIELADRAMYQAKAEGRNKVVFWNENEGASIPRLVA
ncbi:MAG TPA: sensor domain-containing diguanylate cyclase [Dehalococcoidia bacterium]